MLNVSAIQYKRYFRKAKVIRLSLAIGFSGLIEHFALFSILFLGVN
jgi:hypothetical protein